MSEIVVDYPVCLRLAGRPVLVVGGGAVATGRIANLVATGAVVRVVAPEISAEIAAAEERGELSVARRGFRPEDLEGAMLIVVAVDDPLLSEQVASAARVRGQWCTVADRPALCDFTMPSVGRRGPITVAVSTSGKAPALAARLRRRFEAQIWPEDLVIAEGVQKLRGHLPAGKARMKLIRGLVVVAETLGASIRKGLSRPFYRGQASVFNPATRRAARLSVRKAYAAASSAAASGGAR